MAVKTASPNHGGIWLCGRQLRLAQLLLQQLLLVCKVLQALIELTLDSFQVFQLALLRAVLLGHLALQLVVLCSQGLRLHQVQPQSDLRTVTVVCTGIAVAHHLQHIGKSGTSINV